MGILYIKQSIIKLHIICIACLGKLHLFQHYWWDFFLKNGKEPSRQNKKTKKFRQCSKYGGRWVMVPDDVIYCFYDNYVRYQINLYTLLHYITIVYYHCIVMSLYLPPASAGQMEIYIRLDNQSDPLLQAMLELNMLKMSFFSFYK